MRCAIDASAAGVAGGRRRGGSAAADAAGASRRTLGIARLADGLAVEVMVFSMAVAARAMSMNRC
jgi:hypothetical protein